MTKRFWRATGAVMVLGLTLGGPIGGGVAGAQTSVDLGQGWGRPQRDIWYGVSQGSRLIPYAWLAALEAPDGKSAFLDDAYFGKFHYLPIRADAGGRRLPPGFVVDQTADAKLTRTRLPGLADGTPWIGMNCSACHTAQITYGNKGTQAPVSMRVEGGPTGADFQSFIDELNLALTRTLTPPAGEPDRFDKFAKAVLGSGASAADRDTLRAGLTVLVARQTETATQNQLPAGYHYGYGRLDAIGNIYNKVVIAASTTSAPPVPSAPNAPVSYPFLWNVPQHNKVQWDGIAPNDRGPLLPLLRNGGEVIGVFGDIELRRPLPLGLPVTFKSSVDAQGLMQLESTLGSLKPPRWPDQVFGAPDRALVNDGRTAYAANHCADCHALLPKGGIDDLQSPIDAKMAPLYKPRPIGTDPGMACNAFTRTAASGVLKGTLYGNFGKLKSQANVSDMLLVTVLGTLLRDGGEVIDGLNVQILTKLKAGKLGGSHPPLTLANLASSAAPTPAAPSDPKKLGDYCTSTVNPQLAYKGRPLYGVWATAPYLHNGSVATLWDLMLPPAARPTSFWTGTREYDPEKVGFVTDPGGDNSFQFAVADASGPIVGNSNTGHDYGNAQMSDHDRWAIIAYIKAGLPKDPLP